MNRKELAGVTEDEVLMEVGRRAIEDALVEWRDSSRFTFGNNGLVIRTRDGADDSIIRFGPKEAVAIALRAMASVSDAELAALTALYEARGWTTQELVDAYEAEHKKGQGA